MAPVASVFDPVAAPGVVRTEEGGRERERAHKRAKKAPLPFVWRWPLCTYVGCWIRGLLRPPPC